jgi:hypothetical protein
MNKLLPLLLLVACYPGVPPSGTQVAEIGQMGDGNVVALDGKIYITGRSLATTKVYDPASGALREEPAIPSTVMFTTDTAVIAVQQTTFTRFVPGQGGKKSDPVDCAPTVVLSGSGFCVIPSGEVVRIDTNTFKTTTIGPLPKATKIAGLGPSKVYVLPDTESMTGATLRAFDAAASNLQAMEVVLDPLPDHAHLLAAFDDIVLFESGTGTVAFDTASKAQTAVTFKGIPRGAVARIGSDVLFTFTGQLSDTHFVTIANNKEHAVAHRGSGAAVIGNDIYYLAPTAPAWDATDYPVRTIALYKAPL